MAERIEFKNIGVIDRGVNVKEQVKPIGIKTPIRRGDRFGIFDMNTDVIQQIKDNLRNLLLTNHNERLVNNTIGANLRALIFENIGVVNNSATQAIAENIKTAVDEYMPFIELEALEIGLHESDATVPDNYTRIKVTFSVPGLSEGDKISDIDLFFRV
ncbi:hypothetical protein CMI47_03935 [Candidatus Pacearchaeota archaeon]|nr:hypothetical protein [Candidatus Pacearchaeota archaeon]|tara:strand:+ start:488 stop:961 length:474 start_codon:yes stop_codon:yes gene_type:complete